MVVVLVGCLCEGSESRVKEDKIKGRSVFTNFAASASVYIARGFFSSGKLSAYPQRERERES